MRATSMSGVPRVHPRTSVRNLSIGRRPGCRAPLGWRRRNDRRGESGGPEIDVGIVHYLTSDRPLLLCMVVLPNGLTPIHIVSHGIAMVLHRFPHIVPYRIVVLLYRLPHVMSHRVVVVLPNRLPAVRVVPHGIVLAWIRHEGRHPLTSGPAIPLAVRRHRRVRVAV